MRVVIFGGTTEGRRLSEMLSQTGTPHHLCVATVYGADLMDDSNPFMTLHTGRMDRAEMKRFFEECCLGDGDIVVDATHPYATEVSKNIAAALPQGCTMVVVQRDGCVDCEVVDNETYVNRYGSMSDFAGSADSLSGNILITTGSKELPDYCGSVSQETLQRSYFRVLPSSESIGICEDQGIDRKNIIAMHGPFSYEMNKAVMSEYDISHILTKDGGTSGGFEEKLRAATDLGVQIHVIVRPDSIGLAEGVSVSEAFRLITGKDYRPLRRITLAGIGMGSDGGMTWEVRQAILSADAVFGASRMIEAARHILPDPCRAGDGNSRPGEDRYRAGAKVRVYEMYRPDEIIGVLEHEVNITHAVILFSGDTGFYSGAGEAYDKLRLWDGSATITMLPGVSSVSCLAARLFESYDNAKLVSLHGRNSLHNIESLADDITRFPKVFAIMSGAGDLVNVAKVLRKRGIAADIFAGSDLSYESEKIEHMTVDEACGYKGSGLITVLFKKI